MPQDSEFVAGLFVRDDDEGLFSRDINGQLVRLDTPTESDYEKNVTLQIDGSPVTVPLAEPLTDANGNIVVDLEGRTTPRYTTIYDAARKLYVEQIGDEIERVVKWKSGREVREWAGQPVRLRFAMHDADLYSLRFR